MSTNTSYAMCVTKEGSSPSGGFGTCPDTSRLLWVEMWAEMLQRARDGALNEVEPVALLDEPNPVLFLGISADVCKRS